MRRSAPLTQNVKGVTARMGSLLKNDMVDAYLEMCLGVAALRIPAVNSALSPYQTFGIKSSYTHQKEDPIIQIGAVLREVSAQGIQGPLNLRNSFTQVNRVFLLAMWDMLIGTQKYQSIATEPLIQFFRHIRNGCAHTNSFTITSPLTKPASWRDKTITVALHGSTVIPDFLADGDALLLVRDVDGQYFSP